MVAKRRRLDEQIRDVSLAWHVAAFERQKKLPALKELIEKMDQRPQTPTEMKGTLSAIAAHFGLKMRKRTKRG